MLRNDKCDFVTISVVTSIKSFRRLCRLFSQVSPALLDGLCPSLPAVSLRRTSQMLYALPSASPTLLDGFTVTSRRLYLLFPLALPALLDGLSPSLLAVSLRRTSQMLCAFSRFSNRTSRRTWSATSRRFHRHFSPVSPALLKCLSPFSVNLYF